MDPFNRDASQQAGMYDDQAPRDAALSVAIMIVGAAVVLTVMKKSGFRAMVAVGRS